MYINLNTVNRQHSLESKNKIDATMELGDAIVGLESALVYSAKVDMAQKLIDDTKNAVVVAHENKKPIITDVIAYNVNAANEMLGEQVFTMDDVDVGSEGIIGGIANGIKKFVEIIVKSIKAVIKFIGKMIKGIINFIKGLFGKGSSSDGGGSSASSSLSKIEDEENGDSGISKEEVKIEEAAIAKELRDEMKKLHSLSIYCISNKYTISVDNVIGYKSALHMIINNNRELYTAYIILYIATVKELFKLIVENYTDEELVKVVNEFYDKVEELVSGFSVIPYTNKNNEDINFVMLGNNKCVYIPNQKHTEDLEKYKDNNDPIRYVNAVFSYMQKRIIPANLDTVIDIKTLEVEIDKYIVDVDISKVDVSKVKKDLADLAKSIKETDNNVEEYIKQMKVFEKNMENFDKLVDEVSKKLKEESNKPSSPKKSDNPKLLNKPEKSKEEILKERLTIMKNSINVGPKILGYISNDIIAVKDFKNGKLEDLSGQAAVVKLKLSRNKKGILTVEGININTLEKLNKTNLEVLAEGIGVAYGSDDTKKQIVAKIKDKYKGKELEKAIHKAFGE